MTEENTDTRQSDKKILRRLLKLSWNYRAGCVKAILLQVALLIFALSGLNLTGVGIDYINHKLNLSMKAPVWPFKLAPPSDWTDLQVLIFIGVLILIFAILRLVTGYYYNIVVVKLLQQEIVVDLRAKVYEKMQRLSFRFFDLKTSGTLINRVTGDVQSTRLFIDGVIINGAILIISLTVYITYMAVINVKLTVICMATIPFMWFISRYFSKRIRPFYQRDRDLFDKMILDLCERIQGIYVVKGFTREKEELKRLAEDNRAVKEQKEKIFWMTSLFGPSFEMLNQISIVILLLYGGYLVINNSLPLGAGLIVFLGLLQRFSGQVNVITNIIDNIQQSAAAANRVFEIIDAPVEIQSPAEPVKINRVNGGIEFKKVSFGYDFREKVLEDIDFEAKPGQCIGILGTTGAGKSTLLSLIPRFYDVNEGAVFLDGIDIRKYDLDDLRRQTGIVFQESFLFSNTIANNISFGHPTASRDRIVQAAKIAAAHEFITELPEGYDTVIGEAGSDLSGGQRHRLAIARSILLEPPVLLLDDPTASVDSETEKEILESLGNAMKGRTTFLVTHRINVLSRTDLILVLHCGKIVQRGTHDELIKVKGHYRRAAHIQFTDEDTVKSFIKETTENSEKNQLKACPS